MQKRGTIKNVYCHERNNKPITNPNHQLQIILNRKNVSSIIVPLWERLIREFHASLAI